MVNNVRLLYLLEDAAQRTMLKHAVVNDDAIGFRIGRKVYAAFKDKFNVYCRGLHCLWVLGTVKHKQRVVLKVGIVEPRFGHWFTAKGLLECNVCLVYLSISVLIEIQSHRFRGVRFGI